ncbi:MAG: heparin lyase I family protein [Sulfitobacter sp.]
MFKRYIALAVTLTCLSEAAFAQRQTYTDSDWNMSFVDSCGMPSQQSVVQQAVDGDRKLRFSLKSGDIGKCGTDNQARHSAPFWERAELAQRPKLKLGQRHRISAEITFQSGFTGKREAFMQIHGWTQNCKNASPPVMLKFSNGKMTIETLRKVSSFRRGKHRNILEKLIAVKSLYDKPQILTLDFDTTTNPGRLAVSLGGQPLVTNSPVEFANCAEPYVKIGVYRPGNSGGGTSAVVFDNLLIEQVK